VIVEFTRAKGISKNLGPCEPALFIDGVHLMTDEAMSLDDWVRPTEIEAIEMYNGLAGVPPFARGLSLYCGVIAVWTKSVVAR
jgi:hypothetical protein